MDRKKKAEQLRREAKEASGHREDTRYIYMDAEQAIEIADLLDPPTFKDGEIIIEKKNSNLTCISVATPNGIRYFDGSWEEWGKLGRMEFRKATDLEILGYIDQDFTFTLESLQKLGHVLGRSGGDE